MGDHAWFPGLMTDNPGLVARYSNLTQEQREAEYRDLRKAYTGNQAAANLLYPRFNKLDQDLQGVLESQEHRVKLQSEHDELAAAIQSLETARDEAAESFKVLVAVVLNDNEELHDRQTERLTGNQLLDLGLYITTWPDRMPAIVELEEI